MRGRGMDTTQPRFHAGLDTEYQHDSLGISVCKEQVQNKPHDLAMMINWDKAIGSGSIKLEAVQQWKGLVWQLVCAQSRVWHSWRKLARGSHLIKE